MEESSDMNGVFLAGRVVQNAELRYGKSGIAFIPFSVESKFRIKKGDKYETEVSEYGLTLFGKRAEEHASKLTRGRYVTIKGHLRQDKWQDPEGKNRSAIQVVLDDIWFPGSQAAASPKGPDKQKVPEGFTPPDDDFDAGAYF